MNGNFGYFCRSGLAAWSFELPFPAVDVGLNTASLADSEEIYDAFRGVPVANASLDLSLARHEMMKAHIRLNDYLGHGIVPEDLKRSG